MGGGGGAGTVSGWRGLSAGWLSEALAPGLEGAEVTSVGVAPVGTGQVADSVRLRLGYSRATGLPATMVAKVPSGDPASRQAARAVRTYEVEAKFYAEVAPGLDASVPRCHYAAYDADADDYVVLLEDLAPAQPGDQLRGLSPADARAVVGELAVLHAACWESTDLASLGWLNRNTAKSAEFTADLLAGLYGGFVERYGGQLEARTLRVLDGFVPRAGPYLAEGTDARTLAHGDCRADNLMLDSGRRPVLVDWQTCRMGPGVSDLSYLLGSSLLVDDRRAHEEALVRHYHEVLTASGGRLDWADCWEQYRRFAFGGIVTAVVASMIVKRTERGDQMFRAMTNRHAAHALDLDSLSLLR